MRNTIGLFAMAFLVALCGCGKNIATAPSLSPSQGIPYIYQTQWGSPGTGDGQFDFLNDIEVDSLGNVYVMDPGNLRVQKFSSTGVYLTQWGSGGVGAGQFTNPGGLAIDSSDNVYVADGAVDGGFGNVRKFTCSGSPITQFGGDSFEQGPIYFPAGIDTDPWDNVFVVNSGGEMCVQKFSKNGEFVKQFGPNGNDRGQLSGPDGICTDRKGCVYVPCGGKDNVVKYTGEGEFLCEWGGTGSGDGQFCALSCGICVDNNGIVYVADFGNQRIQEFKEDGTYLCQWGNSGENLLGMIDWLALSPTGDKCYVVDGTAVKVFQKGR